MSSPNNRDIPSMRLDKFVSHGAGLSRTDVKRLLRRDEITVDGIAIRDPAHQINPQQKVMLNGEPVHWPTHRYVMLNKPDGYVCSSDDGANPIVNGLIRQPWADLLHSAGRLDVDTTGLVLLTDDGDWSHAITSPKRQCLKTYRVGVRHSLDDTIAQRFVEGLLLNGETKPTLPAQLEILDDHTARVKICEGRYHQIKRMFAACSNRVETLHRESIGAISLDETLGTGEWRVLTDAEVQSVGNEGPGND
jgi:16S rRNA pseudouridine516 synthase